MRAILSRYYDDEHLNEGDDLSDYDASNSGEEDEESNNSNRRKRRSVRVRQRAIANGKRPRKEAMGFGHTVESDPDFSLGESSEEGTEDEDSGSDASTGTRKGPKKRVGDLVTEVSS